MTLIPTYNANRNLKALGVNLQYTEEQVQEYIKCQADPVYFLENYGRVVSLDQGIVPFKLFPYQLRIIKAIHQNKKVLAKLFRQAGKSQVVAGYIAWYVLFNDSKTAAILANKQSIAKEIFSRVQFIIEQTPKWLQQGVKEWNKTSLELENGSRCLAAASSPSAIRGFSCVTSDTLVCVSINEQVYYTEIAKIIRGIKLDKSLRVYSFAYRLTNKITGDVYIDYHVTNDTDDGYMGTGEIIKQAIAAHGPENFIKEIISYTDHSEQTSAIQKTSTQILSSSGFKEFDGFVMPGIREVVELSTNCGKYIRCTPDHRLLLDSGEYVEVANIRNNYVLHGGMIVHSTVKVGISEVFDAVNVSDRHDYYTNGMISHNCNLLLLDEYAHLKPGLAEEFSQSVFPTISSAESSKLIIVSTPKGLNHYHKMWSDAENGLSDFVTVSGHWSEHPHRSQKWADQQLVDLGEVGYAQEVLTEFVGSSYTLIRGDKLANIPISNPIFEQDNLCYFERPEQGHKYVITVDTSRGRHHDYSALTVFDISSMPYNVVATYKDNTISTLEFPHLIFNVARQYNDAYLLIELNDLGEEVANQLWVEYEYENIYVTLNEKLASKGKPGITSTASVKSLGCSVLKDLIEQDQLIINSHQIVQELSIFVKKGRSYAADDNKINDDLCTTLWLFGWLTKQQEFMELTDSNLRDILSKRKQDMIDQSMTPFGFFNDGIDDALSDMKDRNRELPSSENNSLTEDQRMLLGM